MKSISFAWTTEALLAGKKSVTRRFWNDKYALSFKKGEEVLALDKVYYCGGKPIAIIRLTDDPYKEKLSEMTEAEVGKEGGLWESVGDFVKMMGGLDKEPWVVRFEMVRNRVSLGGIWKGVRITEKDIKKARQELLFKLERKWQRP